jgi:ubiquinone biosynthesis protein UbiJ
MRVKEFFEHVLSTILRDHPERAKALGGTVFFDISGDQGGTWFIDSTAQPPRLTKHADAVIDCTVRARDDDFQTMLDDPKAAVTLFQQGRIQVTGDVQIITRFHLLLA